MHVAATSSRVFARLNNRSPLRTVTKVRPWVLHVTALLSSGRNLPLVTALTFRTPTSFSRGGRPSFGALQPGSIEEIALCSGTIGHSFGLVAGSPKDSK